MTRNPRHLAACLLAIPLALVAACGADQPTPTTEQSPAAPVEVKGTVVSTAVSSNEAQIVVPEPVTASWTALGQKGSGLEWVSVAGDGTTKSSDIDLATDPTAGVASVPEKINADAAQSDGRSTLAGLDAIESPAKSPIWVFSPLLDTEEPVDFRELAFDESPASVVKATKKTGELPDLEGREVNFVVTPVAGDQAELSKLQVGYQRAVWEGLAKAAGAKKVIFYDGTGTDAGTGTISAVPIPDPNADFTSDDQGTTRTCTLPSPALFVADQPALIDKSATLKALKKCVGKLDADTKITVEGHTAGSSGTSNDFAKTLSTQRATEVAALLKELDVPAKNIVEVVGHGSSKPLVEPDTDSKNRAVVVTFSTTE
ncbi:MAG TPA: OmpA family protein [Microlunatus sp.]|nr:OmpA family protein [Microlunatus sp.]